MEVISRQDTRWVMLLEIDDKEENFAEAPKNYENALKYNYEPPDGNYCRDIDGLYKE